MSKMPAYYHSWVEINQTQLMHNLASIKSEIGDSQLGVVIKSNAYGHGLENIAKIVENSPQVNWAIAFHLSEAIRARKAGFTKQILVCGNLDAPILEAIALDIDLILHDQAGLERFLAISKELHQPLKVHIKVDTGLTRLGFTPEQAFDLIQNLRHHNYLIIHGLYSHFSESDASNGEFTEFQFNQFQKLIDRLELSGVHIPYLHLANSVAAFRFPASRKSLVRVGGSAYGLLKDLPYNLVPDSYWNLKPILSWKSRISQIRKIPAGTYVSYARTFQAPTAMQVATVPVGYADGYDRQLSNNSLMLVNESIVPVIGRVCMNMCMIDVSQIKAQVNDEVCLLGNRDGIRLTDMMKRLKTISYEITTRINWSIPRITV